MWCRILLHSFLTIHAPLCSKIRKKTIIFEGFQGRKGCLIDGLAWPMLVETWSLNFGHDPGGKDCAFWLNRSNAYRQQGCFLSLLAWLPAEAFMCRLEQCPQVASQHTFFW